MELKHFPPPEFAPEDGIVKVSDRINSEILLESYYHGIFPWPYEGLPILWFCPAERGILEFRELHIPRSLLKIKKRGDFEICENRNFAAVIEACSQQPRPGQAGTWITSRMKKAYLQFHRDGHAHSIEAYQAGQLVGGLYGVDVAGVFAGESMFFHRPNASKLCLLYLVDKLKAHGRQWMDIQMVTPMLKQWGGRAVPRQDFLKRLDQVHRHPRVVNWSGS